MGQSTRLRRGGPGRTRWPLVLILLVFTTLAIIYSIVNPLYEGTDELRHFRFVRVLAETGRLPVQGKEPARSQSHHPPLYYAASAMATFWLPHLGDPYLDRPENPFWGYRYWEVGRDNKNMYLHGPDEAFPWSGDALAAHVARLVNIGAGALTVALTAAILLTICPGRPGLAYGAAGVVAFNPMFLYMSSTVNNDVAAAATGAAVVLACARILRDGLTGRGATMLGISYGLALMAKFSLVFFVPIIELVLLYRALRPATSGAGEGAPRRAAAAFVRANAVVLGLTALIAGWWFVRNQLAYGDPTGFREVTELWGIRDPAESIGLAWSELPNAWSSLWGRFGYGQIPLPEWVYRVLAWAAAAGLLGITRWGIDRRSQRRGDAAAPSLPGYGSANLPAGGLLLLLFTLLVFVAVVFGYMLVSPAGSMGRFFFPALPALAGLLAIGWTELGELACAAAGRKGGRRLPAAVVALLANLALFALSWWALAGFLAPAYARPREVAAENAPNNLGVTLSDPEGPLARLLGYRLDRDAIRPGEALEVTLAWQTIRPASHQYVVFVHAVDEIGAVVAQRDTYPGLGNYPTGYWRPNTIFVETYRLFLPKTAYAPATLSLQAGMYSRDWVYRLEPTPGTEDRAVVLQTLPLEPLPGDLANPQEVNFDSVLRLAGYKITPRQVRPGEGILFSFVWQIDVRPARRYGIILHLLGDENRVWASSDGPSAWHMDEWPINTPVEEKRLLIVPEDVPPGVYQIEVGVWPIGEPARRLPIVAEDGHWIDDGLLLSPVRVLPAAQ